jgi:sRNA-binding regulator protein Hfq
VTPTEDSVLNSFKDKPVKVFLADKNIALHGKLAGHDRNALAIDDGVAMTLVYKNRVISVTEDVDGD